MIMLLMCVARLGSVRWLHVVLNGDARILEMVSVVVGIPFTHIVLQCQTVVVDTANGTEETEVKVRTKCHFDLFWRTKQSIDV